MFDDVLRGQPAILAAELRPPRAGLDARQGIDAWIDTYHGIRRLTRQTVPVFLTDSAVGTQEENNLRHLINNLGRDVPRDRVVPFLTSKHSLESLKSRGARSLASLSRLLPETWVASRRSLAISRLCGK